MIVPATRAPAVLASDASSPSGSRGSAVLLGRITPTRIARSCLTVNSVRFSSDNAPPYQAYIVVSAIQAGKRGEMCALPDGPLRPCEKQNFIGRYLCTFVNLI